MFVLVYCQIWMFELSHCPNMKSRSELRGDSASEKRCLGMQSTDAASKKQMRLKLHELAYSAQTTWAWHTLYGHTLYAWQNAWQWHWAVKSTAWENDAACGNRCFGIQNRYDWLKPCFSFVTIKAQACPAQNTWACALQRIAGKQRTDAGYQHAFFACQVFFPHFYWI